MFMFVVCTGSVSLVFNQDLIFIPTKKKKKEKKRDVSELKRRVLVVGSEPAHLQGRVAGCRVGPATRTAFVRSFVRSFVHSGE